MYASEVLQKCQTPFFVFSGPFNFEAAKTKGDLPKLHLNPYSWSKVLLN